MRSTVCRIVVVAFGVLTTLLLLMLPLPATASQPSINAYVGIPPLGYFVRAIGGSRVHVETLLPPGASPATYEIAPQQLSRLADADVLFTTGVPFETRLLEKLSGSVKDLMFVYTGEEIELRHIDDGREHEGHTHGLHDPHFWLDPIKMKTAVGTIRKALEVIDPEGKDTYRARADSLLTGLDSLDARVERILEPHAGDLILVFHPSYGYFTDRYQLTQMAIEQHGREPSARHLAQTIDQAGGSGIRTLFVQPQFSRKHAEIVAAEIDADVVSLDPLSADYERNLVIIAERIAKACTQNHGVTQ